MDQAAYPMPQAPCVHERVTAWDTRSAEAASVRTGPTPQSTRHTGYALASTGSPAHLCSRPAAGQWCGGVGGGGGGGGGVAPTNMPTNSTDRTDLTRGQLEDLLELVRTEANPLATTGLEPE